jgi:hypothetical protein
MLVIKWTNQIQLKQEYHHNHHKHNQGLGLKTFSFKAQYVLGLSIFVKVFLYPTVPEVGKPKEKPKTKIGIIMLKYKNCIMHAVLVKTFQRETQYEHLHWIYLAWITSDVFV